MEAVICITLREATDRHAHMKSLALQLGIPIEFHVVDRSPRSGLIGCFTSHVEVARLSLERGYGSVLVLEDDIVPTPGYSEQRVKDAFDFCRTSTGWDILKLGFCVFQHQSVMDLFWYTMAPRPAPNVVRWMGLTMHAYCLSREGMRKVVLQGERVLALPDEQVPHFDIFIQSALEPYRCFCVAPMLFDQRWCQPTSNSTTVGISSYSPEMFFRTHQCVLERTNALYYMSLMNNQNGLFIFLLFFITNVVVVLFILHYSVFT